MESPSGYGLVVVVSVSTSVAVLLLHLHKRMASDFINKFEFQILSSTTINSLSLFSALINLFLETWRFFYILRVDGELCGYIKVTVRRDRGGRRRCDLQRK